MQLSSHFLGAADEVPFWCSYYVHVQREIGGNEIATLAGLADGIAINLENLMFSQETLDRSAWAFYVRLNIGKLGQACAIDFYLE